MSQLTISAPGRICLFGDHQDYLGLPVIACAIDRQVILTAEKIMRVFSISSCLIFLQKGKLIFLKHSTF